MKRFSNRQLLIVLIVLVVAVVLLLKTGMERRTMEEYKNGDALHAAVSTALAANSFTADAEFTLHLPERLGDVKRPFTEVTVAIADGVVRGESGFEATGTINGEFVGPGNTLFFNGETRVFSDEVAFRLEDFPVLLNPTGSLSGRWTYVPATLLGLDDGAAVTDSFRYLANVMTYQGTLEKDGVSVVQYVGSLSADDEQLLADAWREEVSGNRVLHMLARLLDANDVKSLVAYINPETSDITLEAAFNRTLPSETVVDIAELSVSLGGYNTEVALDRPEEEAHVRPEVFGKLFGGSELGDVTLEAEE